MQLFEMAPALEQLLQELGQNPGRGASGLRHIGGFARFAEKYRYTWLVHFDGLTKRWAVDALFNKRFSHRVWNGGKKGEQIGHAEDVVRAIHMDAIVHEMRTLETKHDWCCTCGVVTTQVKDEFEDAIWGRPTIAWAWQCRKCHSVRFL